MILTEARPLLDEQTSSTAVTFSITDKEFHAFRELILKEAGISLNDAKRQLVSSRLSKRLRHFGFPTFSRYYDYLRTQDPQREELREMINCITTNKTDFFRENHHFEFLREQVFPRAREQAARGGPRTLRIWSAACSSGEEPYSIAITVREAFGSLMGWDVKILASDIDTNILQQGERGIYAEERFAGMPKEIQRRYFLRGKGRWSGFYQVRPELRDLITFRQLNFIETPWPIRTRFDVIFCRNVIIYFNRETQQILFERLAKHLKEDGYLFVGHSENLHWLNHLFAPLRNTVYQLRPGKGQQ
jgi:chemotaxis protein methyltransferase CheR